MTLTSRFTEKKSMKIVAFLGNLDDLDDLKEVKLEPIVAIGQPRWSGS